MPVLGTYGAASVAGFGRRSRAFLSVRYLIIGGGGCGGDTTPGSFGEAGRGGAGGFQNGVGLKIPRGSYAVLVGIGAARGSSTGGASSLGTLLSVAGGGSGSAPIGSGHAGGSGGGGGNGDVTTGGAGTPGQGNDGFGGTATGGPNGVGSRGGGGGAGGAATSATAGIGVTDDINGTSIDYGIGGIGSTPGSGGNGATAASGGGNGKPGVDGTLIVRYSGPPDATGGVITTVGSDTVHTLHDGDTFTY